ncbi:MAG: glycosyltransferase [Elusimicrobia bacterium]|nr:glycosyltransferase [Elusimicrobiota bacterium]
MPDRAVKPTLWLYTDCQVFGGADIFLVDFLQEGHLREEFDCRLIYRSSQRFDCGLARRLRVPLAKTPVRFPDRDAWFAAANRAFPLAPARLFFKLLYRLLDWPLLSWETLRLYQLFARGKPRLVHINNGGYPGALSCRAAAIAAAWARVPAVVLTVNNITRPLRLPWEWPELWVDRLIMRSCRRFVTASQAAKQALVHRGFPADRTLTISNGIRRPEGLRPTAEVRRELGLSPGQTVLVMTAFFEPRKGHRVLVEAADLLAKAGRLPPEWRLILIGDGPERGAIESLARRCGLSANFLFLGYRNDADHILNAADLLVLPSLSHEDMPLIVLDAMAMGKPVVASAVAGIVEEVEDGRTGLLVPPGDPQSLASAIASLLSSPDRSQAMGRAGKERFEQHFRAEFAARRYQELYQAVLTEEPGIGGTHAQK